MKMNLYIRRWWGEYVGGTDDTCSLLDYFTDGEFKHGFPVEINLKTIMQDFQLTTAWEIEDLRQTKDIYYTFGDGFRIEIHCVINLLMDVMAIILECQKNGKVRVMDLDNTYQDEAAFIAVKAEKEDLILLKNRMEDFIQHPLNYDLAEFCPKDEMREIARQCKEILTELKISN